MRIHAWCAGTRPVTVTVAPTRVIQSRVFLYKSVSELSAMHRAALLHLAFFSPAAALVVNTTRVNGVTAPLAVDIDYSVPTFSWRVFEGSQASYRIIVSPDASFTPALWDSGPVSSAAQLAAYAGAPLPHGAAVLYVSVSASDGTSWSAPDVSTFGTGLDSVSWASRAASNGWIGSCATGDASPALRLSFTLDAVPITSARAYSSALGLYALFTNGQRAGGGRDAVLTPGWATVPTTRVVADAFDISLSLAAGENVLGLFLGQGKYGYNREFCSAADATCYAAVLEVVITQGDNVTVIDTSPNFDWECSPFASGITFNSLFGGETLDARLAQPAALLPNFIPGTDWSPAPRRSPTVNVLSPAPPAMRIMMDLAPVSVSLRNITRPVIAGGAFIISNTTSDPDVWWAVGYPQSTLKYFVTTCSPCAYIDACGALVRTPGAIIDAIPTAASNFSCSLLPNSTVGDAWQFDFGSNNAGFATLALPPDLPANTTLALVFGEILDPSGAVENTFGSSTGTRGCPTPGINCADQTDTYVAGADSTQAPPFAPLFTFHGGRHVALFGWPSTAPPPSLSTLIFHVVYSGMDTVGDVTFNSSILNKLQAAVVRTIRSNLFSIPSDCPTREKRGWMGDAQASSDAVIRNLDASILYNAWSRTFLDESTMGCAPSSTARVSSSSPFPPPVRPSDYVCCPPGRFGCNAQTPKNATGFLPDVSPFDSISGWPGDLVWQIAGVVIPHVAAFQTGDMSPAISAWPMIRSLLIASDAARSPTTGLLTLGVYGDWLALKPVSMSFAQNFYLVRGATLGAELASAIGETADAALFTALAEDVSARMVAALYDPATGVWDGGGTNAQAMALAVGLGGAATAPARAKTAAALVAALTADGIHPTGGVSSARWLFDGLDTIGRADLALLVATQPIQPSFAFMVETSDMPGTIWEEWTGDATHSDGSKNHPMLSGGLGKWLFDGAAGLHFRYSPSPTDPRALIPTVTIAPRANIVRAIFSARAWRELPVGRVDAEWAWVSGRLSITVKNPSGAQARVGFPLALFDSATALRVRGPQGITEGDVRLQPHTATDAQLHRDDARGDTVEWLVIDLPRELSGEWTFSLEAEL